MSNETKWTKGPWELDLREHEQPYQKIRVRSAEYQYRIIAELWMDDSPLLDYNEEQKYNAYLFAAAPDGAALAELVMELCGNPKGLSEAQQDELYETALQFMKKARGETS